MGFCFCYKCPGIGRGDAFFGSDASGVKRSKCVPGRGHSLPAAAEAGGAFLFLAVVPQVFLCSSQSKGRAFIPPSLPPSCCEIILLGKEEKGRGDRRLTGDNRRIFSPSV